MRYARALSIAVLVSVMAVTPLSAFLSGGQFEVWLGGQYDNPMVRVSVVDHTGFVRSVVRGYGDRGGDVSNPLGNRSALSVGVWGGCGDYAVDLSLERRGDGFVINQQNHAFGCGFLILVGHGTVVMNLWSPIDAATVRLESPFNRESVD